MVCPVCKSENIGEKYRPFSMNTVIGQPIPIDNYYCKDCGVMFLGTDKNSPDS